MTEIISIPISSAMELVRRYGDSVPHAALNPSLNIFRAPSIDGLIGFQVVRRCAVVQGDPVCAPEHKTPLADAFATYCANNDWTFLYSAVYRLAYKMLDLHDRFEYWDKFNLTRREPLYLLFQSPRIGFRKLIVLFKALQFS